MNEAPISEMGIGYLSLQKEKLHQHSAMRMIIVKKKDR